MTIREARLAALAEARKWRAEVRECRRIIRKWPLHACQQDADGNDTYDDLRIKRELLIDALGDMNWAGFYTPAEWAAERASRLAARKMEQAA